MRVAILGAGNWGTTMGIFLQRSGHSVSLWEFDAEQARLLKQDKENKKFLPGYALPEELGISPDFHAAIERAEICLLAVPMQSSRGVLKNVGQLKPDTLVLSLMKGIERGTLNRTSEICAQELPDFDSRCFAVLSGPTIAPEVAAGLPTSAVIASDSLETAERIQSAFSNERFRLYSSTDLVSVELAGALKNVIALAAGISDGMNLGVNAKGALITRGLAEITRLGSALGGNPKTFAGLSGMGDLVTTCTSLHSRNRSVGEAIGRGHKPSAVLSEMVMVAEGVWTAQAARDLARKHNLNMPITEAVCEILDEEKSPREALNNLMNRDLKTEF